MDRQQQLREGVRGAYSAVAQQPAGEHPFAVGQRFAEGLGYPRELLERLPRVSVEAFTGVSSVSLFADLPPGAQVLDLGCGAGLDSLIAAERVGPQGAVLGVDFSPAMLARARQAAVDAGADHTPPSTQGAGTPPSTQSASTQFCQAEAENLPLAGASIDVALVNGIFNLNPARGAIFRELSRVVKPGGAVYVAELIRREPALPGEETSLDDWFA
jgi:SAM-dependent methyltransferase